MAEHWIVPPRVVRRAVQTPWALGRRLCSMDDLYNDLWRDDRCNPDHTSGFSPKVDIEERDEELRLVAELPGLNGEDFDVSVDGDLLTIKGQKKLEREVGSKGASLIERSDGSFKRSFRVAWDFDPDHIKASFKNGVLEVLIPRPEVEQPQSRTIPVVNA
jgi:HSP20 family protein